MKIATFTRRVTLLFLIFVFAVMSVSVGLCAIAESDDNTVNVYYFTDYENSDFIDRAANESQDITCKYIDLHRIETYGSDAMASLNVFCNYEE